VVTRKSGGPGIAVIDRIPVSRNLRVISACFGPISTKKVLRSKRIRNRVNALASETFRSLDRDFRPRNFMSVSLEFAHGLGLMSPETARLVELMNDSGAIGATQNMVGQAVHAIAEKDRAQRILRAVTRAFPRIWAGCCELDFAGARVL
jgi:pantoate kinase